MLWRKRRRIISATFAAAAVLLAALVGLTALFAVNTVESEQARLAAEKRDSSLRSLMLALVDAETGVRGYVITGDSGHLEPYYRSLQAVGELTRSLSAAPPEADGWNGAALRRQVDERLATLESVLNAVASGGTAAGEDAIRSGRGKQQMDRIRATLAEAVAEAGGDMLHSSADLRSSTSLLVGSVGLSILVALALSLVQFALFRAEIARRGRTEAELESKNADIRLLSELANALQAANLREESYAVIEGLAGRLLNGMAGALYIYNHSRDQLQLAASWEGAIELGALPATFAPEACWALRRGVPLAGRAGSAPINCAHAGAGDHAYLCMPIQAQGTVYGLLHLVAPGQSHESAFNNIEGVARGLAEQLSLALANLELRERLRNLAIRDGLTGLYNRRFLEEVLERELSRADRNGTKVAVALLDIDHFKTFNDSFGHSIGDEVLKRIAAYLVGTVRKTDVVCRYGGEEVVIVLPDCDVDRAGTVCEKLREGIGRLDLSDARAGLPRVTVSIGVTVYPDLCADKGDLIDSADRAMYRAKRAGRNRVCLASEAAEASERAARTGNVVRVGPARA